MKPVVDVSHDPSCHPQVGLPQPGKHTSPILAADACVDEVLPNAFVHGCVFNDVQHALGEVVQSGSELLRCEAPGVWVRESPAPVQDRTA